jgi:hypothetical protein
MHVGNSNTIISITAYYSNGDSTELVLTDCDYNSDNNSIATVNDSGSAGTATITVTYTEGGITKTDTVEVTVSEIPKVLTSINVLPSSMTINVGESRPIDSVTAYYDNGTNANIALTACNYNSDKPNATVSSEGVITGVASCSASTPVTITVSYTENGIIQTDTVNVTVKSSGG